MIIDRDCTIRDVACLSLKPLYCGDVDSGKCALTKSVDPDDRQNAASYQGLRYLLHVCSARSW